MEIIFNKEDNGGEELKSILGFITAGYKHENLTTDLTHATHDLVKIIGAETYNAIQKKYKDGIAEDASETDKTTYKKYEPLIRLVQTPIACFALLSYEANNDITHDGNGRFSNAGSDQKMPFEWMLKRDESLQRKRGYKSIDILLNSLDSSGIDEWKNSDAYKASKTFFINSVADFAKVVKTFDSYHLLLKMQTFMGEIESNNILPIIGEERFINLKAAILGGESAPEVDSVLLQKVSAPIAYKAFHDAYQILPVEMFADHLNGYDGKPTVDKEAKAQLSSFLLGKYQTHLGNLIDHISKLDTGTFYTDPLPDNNPTNKYFTT